MIKAIKSMIGGFKEIKTSESEYTHVVLEKEEYSKLVSENNTLKDNYESLKKVSILEQKQLKLDFEKKKNEIINEANKRINNGVDVANSLNNKLLEEKELNKSLLRISKERANSKRGIQPKKERSGFMILSMEQDFHSSAIKKRPCWRIKIQTPYNIDLNFIEVQKLINLNLFLKHKENLNIDKIYEEEEFNSLKTEAIDKLWSEKNIVFKVKYKSNIARGFWEIEYKTNRELLVPADMRENILEIERENHKMQFEKLLAQVQILQEKLNNKA